MGIIAYYVHLTAEQMQELRAAPNRLWHMDSDPRFIGAELFDMDKEWEVIPWLLSEKKRAEHKWQTAQNAAGMRDIDGPDAFTRAVDEERKKLGVTTTADETDKMPDDPVLIAIEGRGTKEQEDEAITFGLGGARVFTPSEVKVMAEQLSKVHADDMRRTFNKKEMARWEVGGTGWLEEDDSVVDECLIPAFRDFQAFYKRAANSGHFVLVVYQ